MHCVRLPSCCFQYDKVTKLIGHSFFGAIATFNRLIGMQLPFRYTKESGKLIEWLPVTFSERKKDSRI